jgi:iron complex transport system substrate-binding protein
MNDRTHPAPPRRIVSLVPSTTESVCELGAGDRLVGCTRYCIEPAPVVARTARIGGTKNPSREDVMRLQPDLVLGNAEENRPDDLEWFAARCTTVVQTPATVVEAAAALRELAAVLGGPAEAEVQPWLLRIEAQLAAAAVEAFARPPLRACYVIWRRPWMSVNRSTYIHDLLRVVGAANVCADAGERYPEFVPDRVRSLGVDVVLLASEPWEFDAAQRDELLRDGTFGTARLVLCDGRDFCWHGTRMADGLGRALALMRDLRPLH